MPSCKKHAPTFYGIAFRFTGGWGQQPLQASYGGVKSGSQQQSSPQHRPQQQQQQQQPQQAFAKPNYSSSVIGDREERGIRKNFGKELTLLIEL